MSNIDLQRLESLVADQDHEQAVALLRGFTSRDIHDASLHLRLADLCEAVGDRHRLVYELNFAIRDAPEDVEILKRLAAVHEDAGRTDRALRCWDAITRQCPQDVEAWESHGQLLRDSGRVDEALAVYDAAWLRTGDKRFQARQRLAPPMESIPEDSPGSPSDALLARFVSLFSGREGVYARQWANRKGETGYTPIREPFTHTVARNHLLGNVTVGVYPLRIDCTVNFAAVDLDLARTIVDHSQPGTPTWDGALERLSDYAEALQRTASQQGLHAYLEDSGHKGRHVWIFFETPLPARIARKLGQALCRVAGSVPWDVGIEVFPKQATVPSDGLGNLIKVPMGIHRLTGRRATFIENGAPVAERFILDIKRSSEAAVADFLHQARVPEGEVEMDEARSAAGGRELRVSADVIPYQLESDLEVQSILARCATLRALVEQAQHDRRLSYDESIVLKHALGTLPTGPQAVNHLLRQSLTTDASLFMGGRLRGNPISCPKIRLRIPHVTSRVACNCEFQPGIGLYPTPVLHLTASPAAPQAGLESVQFQALLQDYLRATQQVHDAQRRLERLATGLSDWFEQAGIETFETSMGVLRRTMVGGKPVFNLQV